MGFRSGSYATVWEVRPDNQVRTSARISISRKDKETGQYVNDFSGWVEFIGTGAANKALSLKPRDRIRLGDVDVSNRYVKEKNTTYTNCKIFSFDSPASVNGAQTQATTQPSPAPQQGVQQSAFMDVASIPTAENEAEEYLPF